MSLRDAVSAFFAALKAQDKVNVQQTRPSVAGIVSKRPIGKTNVDTLRRWAQTNEWIRTAIDLRRSQVSSNDWDIVPIDPRAPYDQEMQAAILALFMMPNLRLDSFRTLIEPSIEDLLVLDAGCLEIVRNVRGVPARLYNVDGGTIRIDPTWDGTDENEPRYHWFPKGIWKQGLANDDLIYMMTRPASYRVVGLSTLEILQSTIEADLMAAEYNKGLVTRAAPAGLLNLGEDVQPDQVDAFRAYYEAEVAGRAATAIMGGAKAVQWLGFGQNNREMQFMAWQGYLVRKIAAVFGCAAQDLGITSDQNRSTAEVQQEISEDRGLRPLMLLVEEYLNREIVGSFVRYAGKKKLYAGEIDMITYRKAVALSHMNPRDPHTIRLYNLWEEANLGNLHFNYKIGTGRARREIREDIKTYLNELPIWTINEARAELNLDPIEGGDQILIPTNLGPVKLDDFISGRATATPGAPGQPGMTPGQEKALLDLDGRPIIIDTRQLRRKGKPRSPTIARREQDLAIRVGKWFRDYARKAPIAEWARRATAHEKQIDPDLQDIIDEFGATAENDGLQAALTELIQHANLENYNLGGRLALDRMGIDAAFNLINPQVLSRLAADAGHRVVGIDETTRRGLARVLSEGVAAGKGVDAIAADLRTTLTSTWASINEGSRARLIANTEVAQAMSDAAVETYAQNGLEQKEWETSDDDLVCPECDDNAGDGQIDITDSFSSGDDEPPAHPDCRCAILPVIPDAWNPPPDPWTGGAESESETATE